MPYLQLVPASSWSRGPAQEARRDLARVLGPGVLTRVHGTARVGGAWIERLATQLPDVIIAASPQTAARLRGRVRQRVAVVVAPNGIDIDLIRSVPAHGDVVDVVLVARLLAHKRVDLLLDALSTLRMQGNGLRARSAVGDGPGRGSVMRRVAELGLEDAVELRHDVHTQADLYSLMKASRIFAFPSEREGFGVAVLEALACGLPVVTTSAPDNLAQELVRRSQRGVVCEARPDAFASAIDVVLRRTPSPPTLADVDPWVAEYDWSAVSRTVAQAVLS